MYARGYPVAQGGGLRRQGDFADYADCGVVQLHQQGRGCPGRRARAAGEGRVRLPGTLAVLALAMLAFDQMAAPAASAWLKEAAPPEAPALTFEDITLRAGIRFTHTTGAFGKKYLPETMGPGVAFIDYDKDGWPDIFLVNGMEWPGHAGKRSTPRLYHNNQDGTFSDV